MSVKCEYNMNSNGIFNGINEKHTQKMKLFKQINILWFKSIL